MVKKYNEFITVRCEDGLKKNFEGFCAACGMSVSDAVALLIRNTIKEQRIPFVVSAAASLDVGGFYEGGFTQSVRYTIRVEKKTRDEFKEVCEKVIGMKMSRLIKMFMLTCVKNGKLPFSGSMEDEDFEDGEE